jgi:hypothetical protein
MAGPICGKGRRQQCIAEFWKRHDGIRARQRAGFASSGAADAVLDAIL